MEQMTIWMLVGFIFATYSVTSNDSVQTLGTFIASNRKFKWYYLWIFASAILVATITYSWLTYGGDISYGRLTQIPFIEIQWYHALAPLALVGLTRVGVPVSTSLLVLSVFASSLVFEKILLKSALGYLISGVGAYVLWLVIGKIFSRQKPIKAENEKYWRVVQWFSTGFLWYSWLAHDMANIAVFLPRSLDVPLLILVLVALVAGLGSIFWNHGGKIQDIVLTKTDTTYVRSATFIDLFYAFVLLYLKGYNDLPMSTTWVFVGMLCGRELAMATIHSSNYSLKDVFPIVGKDMLKLVFGLFVSVVIALLVQNIDEVIQIFSF